MASATSVGAVHPSGGRSGIERGETEWDEFKRDSRPIRCCANRTYVSRSQRIDDHWLSRQSYKHDAQFLSVESVRRERLVLYLHEVKTAMMRQKRGIGILPVLENTTTTPASEITHKIASLAKRPVDLSETNSAVACSIQQSAIGS